jgi:GH24 family phage-related lysozyme (muramidase)
MTEVEYEAPEDLEGSNVQPVPPEDEEGGEEPAAEEESPGGVEAAHHQPSGLSAKGADFIGRFEGTVLHLYNDPVGHCTIGIGHLVHHGRCNGSEPQEFKRGITKQRAVELLMQDTAQVSNAIHRHVRVPLTQPQFDALCSWAFNCGVGVLSTSTLVRRLNQGDHAAVPAQLARWDKAGSPPRPVAGLTRRRKAEGKLYAQGKYE